MNEYTIRFPEQREFVKDVEECFNKSVSPAEEVLLDDLELCAFLKISKRMSAYMRDRRQLTFHKIGGKIIYRLCDVLIYVNQYKVPVFNYKLKFKS